MDSHFPAIKIAYEFVSKIAHNARKQREYRLPSISSLAHDAGVSRMSMVKALALLKDEGVIVAIRGQGMHVCPRTGEQPPSVHTSPTRKSLEEKTLEAIQRDIFGGRFCPGSVLPTMAEMCERYGISTGILRRVLQTLVQQGYLFKNRRQYRLITFSSRPNATIILLTRADNSGNILFNTTAQLYFQLLSSECNRYEVELRSYPLQIAPLSESLQSMDSIWDSIDTLRDNVPVLGCIIYTIGLMDTIGDLLQKLVPMRVPVSIVGPEPHHGNIVLDHRPLRVRWFSECNNFQAGVIVGKYLRMLGHRKIAYISTLHGSTWSQHRLDGLMHTYKDLGAESVELFVNEKANVRYDFARYNWSNVETLRKTLRNTGTQPKLRPIVKRFYELTPKVLSEEIESKIICQLQRAVVESDGITAWITAQDHIGLLCLDFLNHCDIDVPKQISVVSFDDTLAAFTNGLTSFNFGLDTSIHMAVTHILQPYLVPRRSSQHLFASGTLKIRNSSGNTHNVR